MDWKNYVERAKQQDMQAQETLYKATVQNAYFTAKKVSGSEQDALDLVHDAYITAFEQLDQLKDAEKFQSWLNAIIANKCRDYLKKKKPILFTDIQSEDGPEPDWEDDRSDVRPDLALDDKETVHLIAQILETIPEEQQLCIMLYYRDEMSVSEIAQALGISEGTVKSRLNYARKKVKSKVEELEQQGTKLYGVAPLPFLAWLLRNEAASAPLPEALTASHRIAVGKATASTVINSGIKSMTAGMATKITAGLLAAVTLTGGIAVYTSQQDNTEDIRDAAYQVYEDLLRQKETDSGLLISHYAYLDLNQDEIPELLVADGNGTQETITEGEVYCFQNEELNLLSDTGAYYDWFYLVNGTYLCGSSRLGRCYVSMDETIDTIIYHWNTEMTRNDPAIRYTGEDWDYITREEFVYYNLMPEAATAQGINSFIKTAEKVMLISNQNTTDTGVENMNKKLGSFITTAFATLILSGCGTSEVNMQDYTAINYSGLNTMATAQLELDDEAFLCAALGTEPETDAELLTYVQNEMRLLAAIDYTVSPNTNLKNGDKVTVTITYDEPTLKDLNISLNNTSWEHTVEGLKDGIVADLFSNLVITYEGIDGQGRVSSITNHSNDSFISTVKYTAQTKSGLKNGDTITIRATCEKDNAYKNGYLLDKMETEVVVSGLGAYLTDVDQLTPAIMQTCWDKAKEEMPSIGMNTVPVKGYLLLYEESPEYNKSILDYESIFVLAYQPADGFEPFESVRFVDLVISEDQKVLMDYYLQESKTRYSLVGAQCGGDTLEELKEEVIEEYLTYTKKHTLYEIDCAGIR